MKRKFLITLTVIAMLSSVAIGGQAAEVEDARPALRTHAISIQPRADVIQTKYRTYGNLLQARRWNATRGYWVDSNWITIGVAT